MQYLKKIFLPALLFICCLAVSCTKRAKPVTTNIILDSVSAAEKNPYATEDQSPLDMSYFPVDYPLQKMNKTDSEPPIARVIYSRPHKKGRTIFGNDEKSLCRYGREWRLGANEATEIDFFKNVSINGKNMAKGSYIIYCIPYPDKWTIVFSNNLYTWGLHMDASKDIFRTDIPVTEQSPPLEDFTIVFSPAKYGADLVMAWDNVKTQLPIEFSK